MEINNVNVPKSARRYVDYHPSVWGDYFLAYDSSITDIDHEEEGEVERLRDEVKKMLIEAHHATSTRKLLELIDNTQRLGVSYHFEKEIEESLKHIYNNMSCGEFDDDDNNLDIVALRFRLLRQVGYNVSCDVIERFKDDEGNFKKELASDVKGILSLYEAAHLGISGENILEEALVFTTKCLKSMVPKLSGYVVTHIVHALKMPIRRTLARVAARQYINMYQDNPEHSKVLLQFARLDFNMLQKLHQKELSGITRWWKGLDVERNFSFARDRLVEAYLWMIGVYFEPQYCRARRFTTQIISLASILDDLYDVYGTHDELEMFTDAIQRWDINASQQLPPYLKLLYQYIFDTYAEMEELLAKENISYRVHYAKNELKKLVRAYHQEFKWYHSGYVPTFEEYLKVALVTACYMMLSTTSLVGMEEELVSEENFKWITSEPLMVKASSIVCRLMDDRIGHKFEQERGHVASAVESYVKEFECSKQEAYVKLEKLVVNAWQDLNKDSLQPMPAPMLVLMRVLNFARAINLIYKDEDIYTNSKTKLKDIITKFDGSIGEAAERMYRMNFEDGELLEEDDDEESDEEEETESSIDLLVRFVQMSFPRHKHSAAYSTRIRNSFTSSGSIPSGDKKHTRFPSSSSVDYLHKLSSKSSLPSVLIVGGMQVTFAVDGVLILALLSILKAFLEVICSLGGAVFVAILFLRVLWSAVSYFQSTGSDFNSGGSSYGRTQPTA
uniref:(-)-germacrene D synthase n=1 Tax=Solanum tuberosum TaxID=4113 RepID=M0ZP05_SOLTU